MPKREIKEINEPQIRKAIKAYYAKRGFNVSRVRITCCNLKTGGTLVAAISFDPNGPHGLQIVELRESAINNILNGGNK